MYSIAQAANILDTSEYEVLCRAYADWHGAPANAMIMQRAFSQYFRQGQSPYWARHYTRKVIQDFEQRHTQQAGALHSFLLMWLGRKRGQPADHRGFML